MKRFTIPVFTLALLCSAALLVPSKSSEAVSAERPKIEPIHQLAINGDNNPIATPENTAAPADTTEIPTRYCLKDDYFLFVQNQTNTGLCWNYASSAALSTTIAKATGEYDDFSEVFCSATYGKNAYYVPNAGGTYSGFNTAARNYGLIYEHDLQATEAWFTHKDKLAPFVDYYSKNLNTITMQNIVNSSSFNLKNATGKENAKRHLLEHGGLYISATWRTSQEYTTTKGNKVYAKVPNEDPTPTGAHAVCLIGWDDDVCIITPGKTFRGAWIFQNSYGERELNLGGIGYIFYDDNQLHSYAYGYRFEDKTSTSAKINFVSRIESSTANLINNRVGIYFEDGEITSKKTNEKNVFYSKDVKLDYSYTVTSGTEIKDIEVWNCDIDVTRFFDIKLDQDAKKYSLKNFSGYPLDYGAYTVKIKLEKGDETNYAYNAFYCLSGAEVNTMFLRTVNGRDTTSDLRNKYAYEEHVNDEPEYVIENLGYYYLFNSGMYSPHFREFRTAVPTTEGYIDIEYYINMNDDIDRIELDGVVAATDLPHCRNYLRVNYSGLSSENKTVKIMSKWISKTGNYQEIPIILDYAEPSEHYLYLKIDPNGGTHTNPSKFIHKVGDNFTLKAPTRPGYKFKGWYYDRNFEEALEEVNGEYLFDDSHLIDLGVSSSSNNYSCARYRRYYMRSHTGYVYAKWEEAQIENFRLITPNEAFKNASTPFTYTLDYVDAPGYKYDVYLYVDDVQVKKFNKKSAYYRFTDNEPHSVYAKVFCTYKGHETVVESGSYIITPETKVVPETRYYSLTTTGENVKYHISSSLLKELSWVDVEVSPERGYLPINEVEVKDSQNNVTRLQVVDGKVTVCMTDNLTMHASTSVDTNQKFKVSCSDENISYTSEESYIVGETVEVEIKSENRSKKIVNAYALDEDGNVIGEYNKKNGTLKFTVNGNIRIVVEYKEPVNVKPIILIAATAVIDIAIVSLFIILVRRRRML